MQEIQKIVEKMKRVRLREDLKLPKLKHLLEFIEDESGNKFPLSIRYYQVQGILHMIMVNRFLLGDDTGLGKCVVEDTLISTERGLIRAGDLNPGVTTPDTFKDIEDHIKVMVGKSSYPVKRFYYGGVKPTRWIRTQRGFHIEGSLIHPVKNRKGEWVQLRDVGIGDQLKISCSRFFPATAPKMSNCSAPVKSARFNHEWAAYIGLLYGMRPDYDNTLPMRYSIHLNWFYKELLEGAIGSTVNTKAVAPDVRQWWRDNGFCPSQSPEEVPWPILQGTRLMVQGFLKSFIAIRGKVVDRKRVVACDFLNHRMAKDIQLLLFKCGVLSHIETHAGWWTLCLQGDNLNRFSQEIGWAVDGLVPSSDTSVKPLSDSIYDTVEEWGDSEKVVVDIEVDDPSHTFESDCFTSHNTLQSIATSCYFWEKNQDLKVVVITIKSAVRQWADEYDRFTQGVTVYVSVGSPKKRAKILEEFWAHEGSPAVLIMGYGSMLRDLQHYQDWQGYMLIVDEASAVKNHLTETHKHVRYMSKNASRVVGLTATMIENRLTEGWGIYNALVPGLFGNYPWFMKEFCVTQMMPIPGSNRKIPTIVGYRAGAVERFKEMIFPYFIGRSKLEVATELPPLTRRTVQVPLSKVQKEKYEEALSGTLMVTKDGVEEEKATTKLTSLIYCQQIVNHPELIGALGDSGKMDALMELLTQGELSDDDCKVIVFSRFKTMIDLIMAELTRCGIGCTRITGAENEKQREIAKKAFQNVNSKERVICVTEASKQAVNLQSAKAIVFVDTPWSAGDFIQILGRMIRIGSQHDSVLAYHLVAQMNGAMTIDGHVLRTLGKKIKLVESVLGKRIKGDSDEDVEVLPKNDISELFDALRQDAQRKK